MRETGRKRRRKKHIDVTHVYVIKYFDKERNILKCYRRPYLIISVLLFYLFFI